MKKESIFDNVMHFLVHNSFLFTVIIMCLVHATLLGATWYFQIMPLRNFNILSVTIYLFCIILCLFGHIMPVYVSIFLEVSIYSVVAVHFIGWESGSQFFLFAIVPIIIYFGCFLLKGTKRWIIFLLLVLDFATYVYLYNTYADATSVFELSHISKTIMMLFTSFVMFFSIVFYSSIYIYSSEYEMIDLEQQNEKLSADATKDLLTNLLNRRGFLPLVADLMKGKKKGRFCIAFCDIDNFKRINDSYGHDCGDEVLRHISKTIKKELANSDVCRWGGEEIVILMKECDFVTAKQKLELLRKNIEFYPTIFYNKRIPATITIGLEEYREIYNEPEEIIKVADDRMYYGKQHGKNVLIFEDVNNIRDGV